MGTRPLGPRLGLGEGGNESPFTLGNVLEVVLDLLRLNENSRRLLRVDSLLSDVLCDDTDLESILNFRGESDRGDRVEAGLGAVEGRADLRSPRLIGC